MYQGAALPGERRIYLPVDALLRPSTLTYGRPMYLTHLSLTNFRNFARLDLDVPAGGGYCW